MVQATENDASSCTVNRDVGSATKSLQGCVLGFFGVLHTWGRDPATYHPHIHYVVPGGGVKLDENGDAVSWQSTPKNFLFHHATLIRVYKAKLPSAIAAATPTVPTIGYDSHAEVMSRMRVQNGIAVNCDSANQFDYVRPLDTGGRPFEPSRATSRSQDNEMRSMRLASGA